MNQIDIDVASVNELLDAEIERISETLLTTFSQANYERTFGRRESLVAFKNKFNDFIKDEIQKREQ